MSLRKSQSSGAEHRRVIEGHITNLHSHNHWSLLGVLGCLLGLPNMDCQIVYGLLRCSSLEIHNTQSMGTSISGINA